jgi:hypothetical protein
MSAGFHGQGSAAQFSCSGRSLRFCQAAGLKSISLSFMASIIVHAVFKRFMNHLDEN